MAILFLNGTVIDGNGGLVERGALLATDGTIEAVGSTASLEGRRNDPDIQTVDLDGRTLMPGLIDTHVHLAGGDFEPNREADPVGLAAFRMVPPALRTLQAGFTTIRVAGSRDFLDVDLRDAIAEGAVVGPRILASGRGLTTTGGHYHNWCAVEVDGVDAVRREVRSHVKRGVDSIKLMLSPGIATEGSNVNTEQFSLDEVQTAVYEAHKVGKSVLSHAIGIGGIRNGVEAGVDSIDHGCYLDEEQALKMKAKGISFVPTFGPFYYYVTERFAEPWRIERAEQVTVHHLNAFKIAMEVGVPIALGSDCGMPSRFPNGRNALEFVLYARNGMPNEQVLVAGTSSSAKLLGLECIVGSIEPGKQADLVVLDGNPLDDMQTVLDGVSLVMKGGTIVRDDHADLGGRTDVDYHAAV